MWELLNPLLVSDVNMKSIHEKEVSNKCVGSWSNWCNPNCDVMLSIPFPLKVDLSWHCQLLDLALKFPIATTILLDYSI